MFYGLGAAIILLAAMAAGRFSVVGVRDMELASAAAERTIVMPDARARADCDPRGNEAPAASEVPVGTPTPAYREESPAAAGPTEQPASGSVQEQAMTEQPHKHRRFVFR